MIGLSTCWLSLRTRSGSELLDMISKIGLDYIELEYRITPKMYHQMKPMLKKKNPRVLSVHNFFPVPDILLKEAMGGGDVFPFSSEDKEVRKLAITYTKRTIQVANDLEAWAVVLHLGKVNMKAEMKKFYQLYDKNLIESEEAKDLLEQKKKERSEKRDKHLDSVKFCLEAIIREAIKQNIILGIENAFRINGIPDFDEIGTLLKEFEGAPLGYWHDVGHAQVKENLGWHSHREFLDSYKDYLIGIHLHDINGYKDHLAPGIGEFDFTILKEYLSENIIKIIEVNNTTTEEELLKGISFLGEKGFQ